MDLQNPVFTEEHKNKIGTQLLEKLAQALKEERVTIEDTREISTYVLDNINNIKDKEELITFLKNLSSKWPIFSDVLTMEKGKEDEKKENLAVDKVEDLIKENKIEEALKAAETATEKGGANAANIS